MIYGIAGIVSRMITVFLVPIYTRIFQPSDYGTLYLINTTFLLAGILSTCALDSAAGRWYYDTDDQTDRKRTFASWFWFQLVLTSAVSLLLFLALPLFSNYVLNIPASQLWWIWLLPCCTLISNILPNMIWNWYRLNRLPKQTVLFTLSQSVFTIVLTILFVVFFHWRILGVYAALFISSLFFSIIALIQMNGWLSIEYFSRERTRQMLRFAIPLIPAALAFWLLNSTNAYFIRYFKNTAEVGLFSVGASLASVVGLFTGAFQQAWGPFAFSIINEPDAKKTYANVFLAFGMGASVLVLGMFLFSPEILRIFTTPAYYASSWVASILSINIVLIAFTYIASIGTSIVKNTIHYSVGVVIAGVVTIGLNILLIPYWGKEGSATANVLGQLIVPVYLFSKAQKLYRIEYNFWKVSFCMLLAIGIGIAGELLEFNQVWTAISVKAVLLILFCFCILFFIRKSLEPIFIRLRAVFS